MWDDILDEESFVVDIWDEDDSSWFDIRPYLEDEGFQVTRNDVDSPDTGRMMNADMDRDRVAIKKKIQCNCRRLRQRESQKLLRLIRPKFIRVRYTDPEEGIVEKTMYSNNVPASVNVIDDDGVAKWKGISFPLIEK